MKYAIFIPCYLFREFLWRLGNIRRCRGVKSGDCGLKIQNFPVNSLLLYAIDRRIVYLRQEYKKFQKFI